MEPTVCVSIHDVAPSTWPQCAVLLKAMAQVGPMPVTLLVVPDYHRQGTTLPAWYRNALEARLARGDELALHGYCHLDEGPPPRTPGDWLVRRIYTAGEGEFAALPVEDAKQRLAAGHQWFQAQGWPLHGFVAPAWLLGPGAWAALGDAGFLYTTTLREFHLPAFAIRLAAPAIVYSPRSLLRRAASLAWNRIRTYPPAAPLIRLALHPADAAYPAIVRQAQELLAHLLEEGRTAMTKAGFAAGLAGIQLTGTVARDNKAAAPPMATPASTSLG